MNRKGPRDLHFLIALRERNPWVGTLFFLIGLGLFGFLFFELLS